MNSSLSDEMIEQLQNEYPKGTRLEVIKMRDPYPLPPGAKGTVICVEDSGTIQMEWDNGRRLSLIPGADTFKKVTVS